MTSYELWLFLHIAGAIVWIGGAVLAQVFGVLAKRSADPQRAAAYGRDMAFVGPKIFMPAAIVVLVTGALLTEDGNWDWSEPFVYLGLIGGVGVALAAFGYLTRAMGAAGAQLAREGPSPALVARLGRLVLIGRLLILVLFVIVFLMVVKPGT
jgi:uncharacterized membrane protein